MVHDERRFAGVEIAAPGWRASYQRERELTLLRVVAWAVVETLDGGLARRDKVGLVVKDGRITLADRARINCARFREYVAPSSDLNRVAAKKQCSNPKEESSASSWFG